VDRKLEKPHLSRCNEISKWPRVVKLDPVVRTNSGGGIACAEPDLAVCEFEENIVGW